MEDNFQSYYSNSSQSKKPSLKGLIGLTLNEIHWRLHPQALSSRQRMKKYKNLHQGESCVIIGNGPSLKRMDLSWLKNRYTFGLNRIYLLFPELGFTTTYFVSVNRLVLEQSGQEIEKIKIPKFINWRWKNYLKLTDQMVYLRHPRGRELNFSKNPGEKIWEGSTVTYVALQLAYYMGFTTVYLIGVDHNFKTQGSPHKVIVSEGEDPDHFHPDYFGKGFKWMLPDLKRSEQAFQIAKEVFESGGRRIIDATLDGKLDIFSKIDYRSLIE
jgi:hypothetical protein